MTRAVADLDRLLIRATQAGLPLVADPWGAVAAEIGTTADVVRARLAAMLADGRVRRIAAVPNHYALGLVANGMSVWDVADDQVDAVGERFASRPGVTHCYRRPRRLPEWRYNLFAMVHGRTREEVQVQVKAMAAEIGAAARAHEVLYSTAILKKTGFRLREGGA